LLLHNGSVSAVTFVTAATFLELQNQVLADIWFASNGANGSQQLLLRLFLIPDVS
jgi:hypothetical protein